MVLYRSSFVYLPNKPREGVEVEAKVEAKTKIEVKVEA